MISSRGRTEPYAGPPSPGRVGQRPLAQEEGTASGRANQGGITDRLDPDSGVCPAKPAGAVHGRAVADRAVGRAAGLPGPAGDPAVPPPEGRSAVRLPGALLPAPPAAGGADRAALAGDRSARRPEQPAL